MGLIHTSSSEPISSGTLTSGAEYKHALNINNFLALYNRDTLEIEIYEVETDPLVPTFVSSYSTTNPLYPSASNDNKLLLWVTSSIAYKANETGILASNDLSATIGAGVSAKFRAIASTNTNGFISSDNYTSLPVWGTSSVNLSTLAITSTLQYGATEVYEEDNFILSGTLLYGFSNTSFQIKNISPSSGTISDAGTIQSLTNYTPKELHKRGNYVYCIMGTASISPSNINAKIRIINVTSSSSPSFVTDYDFTVTGEGSGGGFSSIIKGSLLYVCNSESAKLWVFSLANPTSPIVLGKFSVSSSSGSSFYNSEACQIGNHLYFPTHDNHVIVVPL